MGKAALVIAYYCVITPTGLLTRLVRDPLRRRIDVRRTSYWIDEPTTAARKDA